MPQRSLGAHGLVHSGVQPVAAEQEATPDGADGRVECDSAHHARVPSCLYDPSWSKEELIRWLRRTSFASFEDETLYFENWHLE